MQRVDEGFRLPSPVVCTIFSVFFVVCIRKYKIRTINNKHDIDINLKIHISLNISLSTVPLRKNL